MSSKRELFVKSQAREHDKEHALEHAGNKLNEQLKMAL